MPLAGAENGIAWRWFPYGWPAWAPHGAGNPAQRRVIHGLDTSGPRPHVLQFPPSPVFNQWPEAGGIGKVHASGRSRGRAT
jgi:hypothetical protein